MIRASHRLLMIPVLLIGGTVCAQPFPGGGWGHRGLDNSAWDETGSIAAQGGAEPSRRVDVATFRSPDAADRLGKGRIVMTAPPSAPLVVANADGDAPQSALPSTVLPSTTPPDEGKIPVYEAAVTDRLAAAGYDIAHAQDPDQTVELTISRDVVAPDEAPHKPVSGEMSIGVGNRGMRYGMAVAVDLSRPKKAIVATRLDVRIRDARTRRVLWEGHAEGQARLTDNGDDDTRMATRLAHALFAGFPDAAVVAVAHD